MCMGEGKEERKRKRVMTLSFVLALSHWRVFGDCVDGVQSRCFRRRGFQGIPHIWWTGDAPPLFSRSLSLRYIGTLEMAIFTPDTNQRHRGHTTPTQFRGNFDWNNRI